MGRKGWQDLSLMFNKRTSSYIDPNESSPTENLEYMKNYQNDGRNNSLAKPNNKLNTDNWDEW